MSSSSSTASNCQLQPGLAAGNQHRHIAHRRLAQRILSQHGARRLTSPSRSQWALPGRFSLWL
jgi:hypothetical protein